MLVTLLVPLDVNFFLPAVRIVHNVYYRKPYFNKGTIFSRFEISETFEIIRVEIIKILGPSFHLQFTEQPKILPLS